MHLLHCFICGLDSIIILNEDDGNKGIVKGMRGVVLIGTNEGRISNVYSSVLFGKIPFFEGKVPGGANVDFLTR